jgi:hypothetical protein
VEDGKKKEKKGWIEVKYIPQSLCAAPSFVPWDKLKRFTQSYMYLRYGTRLCASLGIMLPFFSRLSHIHELLMVEQDACVIPSFIVVAIRSNA